MALKLGYRTMRTATGALVLDYVEAIDPALQNDFESMMLLMIGDRYHGEEPSPGYEDAKENADTASDLLPAVRLGYSTQQPKDGTVARDNVEAINPELQRDFENMMLSMIAAP